MSLLLWAALVLAHTRFAAAAGLASLCDPPLSGQLARALLAQGAIVLACFLAGPWRSTLLAPRARSLFAWGARRRRSLGRAFLLALGPAVALLGAEACFRLFIRQSDGFGFTLASQRWFERHWTPINALGFRDVEHDVARIASRTTVLVVGDSFVAGHGVEDVEDRFSNVLGTRLGAAWAVLNLGTNGWDTEQELAGLVRHPARADVVVLSYFVNDITVSARATGSAYDCTPVPPRGPGAWIVGNSHVANYVYWRLYRFGNRSIGTGYWDMLRGWYSDERVWLHHRAVLLRFVEEVARRRARLIVVIFPNLMDVPGSRPATSRVARCFEEQGVRVLDLTERLAGRDPGALIVNTCDPHPGVQLHAEVGELLAEQVRALERE